MTNYQEHYIVTYINKKLLTTRTFTSIFNAKCDLDNNATYGERCFITYVACDGENLITHITKNFVYTGQQSEEIEDLLFPPKYRLTINQNGKEITSDYTSKIKAEGDMKCLKNIKLPATITITKFYPENEK